VQGLENLPVAGNTDAVVLLSKHQSTWETFAYPTLMPHPLAYVFKRELLYVPFFGWAMGRMDMIHIDRSKPQRSLEQGGRARPKLRATRHLGDHVPGRAPASNAASKASTRWAARVWPSRQGNPWCRSLQPRRVAGRSKSFLVRPGVVDISIGRRSQSLGREPEELMREVETWIEAEMHRLDAEAYASQPAAAGGATAS
jgi:1-acyl-sn-glycerol-3-phosphate acyltransferase